MEIRIAIIASSQSWVVALAGFFALLTILLLVTIVKLKSRVATAARSDQKFRRLLSSNIIGVVFWKLGGDILEANDSFLNMVGYTREELRRGEVNWRKLTSPEYALVDAKAIAEMLETGACQPFEKEYIRKDGERVAVLIGSALFDAHEETGSSFILDITERKKAEAALRESETRFRQLAENISQIIWLANPDATRIHYVSPAYEEIWGRSCASLRANPASWMDLIHPEDRERIAGEERLQLLTGQHDHTYRIVRPDSSIRWIRDRAFPVRDESGNLIRIAGIAEDITERKRAEERLREYERVVEGLEEMIVVVDRDYRYLLANRAYLNFLGLEREELIGRPVVDVLGREVFAVVADKLYECLTGKTVKYEMKFRLNDGRERDILVSYSPIEGPAGIDRIACVLQDITEHKRAEKALRESEERFRELAENINVVFWVWDAQEPARLLYVSPAYATIWGRSSESIYSSPQSWKEALHRADKNWVLKALSESDLEKVNDLTYRIVRPDQSVRWMRDRIFPVRDENGVVVRLAEITEDITENKLAEEELQQANEQLRVLSRRLFQVQENERRHLARELHDEIGQTLTAAKINLGSIARTSVDGQSERLEESIGLLDTVLGQVRQISLDLHPSLLDDLGLVPALRSMLDRQARRAGLRARFSAFEPPEEIERDIQTTAFRIAQEAITNVLRHAGAQFIAVDLRGDPAHLEMRIVDDGRGFDPAKINGSARGERAFGLVGMKERAALVGGHVRINSSIRKGTAVEVSLPLTSRRPGEARATK